MKSLSFLAHITIAFMVCSCAEKTASTSAETSQTKHAADRPAEAMEKPMQRPLAHPESRDEILVVTFSSRGSGINVEARAKLEALIKTFQSGKGVKLNYDQKTWGREGEVDYCFDLSVLNSELNTSFSRQVTEGLSMQELVTTEYLDKCPH